MADRAIIPDFSYWNGPVDFNKVKAKGSPCVILRSSWGMYSDSMFEINRNQCDAIGLPWIAYHYYDFSWSLDANLAAFKNTLAGRFGLRQVMDLEQDPSSYAAIAPMRELKAGEIPEEVLDVMPFTRERFKITTLEDFRATISATPTLVPTQVQGIAWSFLNQVKQFSGKAPWLYEGFFYHLTWMTNDPKWKEFKLWLAWYAAEQYVKTPPPYGTGIAGGGGWTAWQYTSKGGGPEWGSTGLNQDLSLYYSTAEQFRIDMGVTPIPPEPPTPPTPPELKEYEVTCNVANVRSPSSASNAPVVGYVYAGNVLTIDKIDTVTDRGHIYNVDPNINLGWVWMQCLKPYVPPTPPEPPAPVYSTGWHITNSAAKVWAMPGDPDTFFMTIPTGIKVNVDTVLVENQKSHFTSTSVPGSNYVQGWVQSEQLTPIEIQYKTCPTCNGTGKIPDV